MVRPRCLHLILYSNNLMFPKEENSGVHRSRLIYKCDNCGYMEDAGEPCIFRISYKAESRWKFVVWFILDQFLTWWTTILWRTLLSVVTRTKSVKSAMKRAACFSRLTVMETKRWRWFSCAFIVNISGLDNLFECLFQTKLRVLPIKCLVSNRILLQWVCSTLIGTPSCTYLMRSYMIQQSIGARCCFLKRILRLRRMWLGQYSTLIAYFEMRSINKLR